MLLATFTLLLHKTTNFSLFPLILIQASILCSVTSAMASSSNSALLALIFSTVGQAAWFCFGNSNALSTIDISGAYTGLVEYNQVVVAILVYSICYTGPLVVAAFLARLPNLSGRYRALCAIALYKLLLTFVAQLLGFLAGSDCSAGN